MRRRDYLLAHVLARLVFLVPETTVPFVFGALAFGVPMTGGWLSLGIVVLTGAVSFSAIGLLAASRAATFEGISGVLNAVQVPMWILSGVFFSSANFPDVLQPMIALLPLTALVDALRAVALDGAGPAQLVRELLVLGGWGGAAFAAALWRFRWR